MLLRYWHMPELRRGKGNREAMNVNRTMIMLVQIGHPEAQLLRDTPGARILVEAESNSPDDKPLLAGRGDKDSPEVREFVEELLKMLPPTYGRDQALLACKEAIAGVFL